MVHLKKQDTFSKFELQQVQYMRRLKLLLYPFFILVWPLSFRKIQFRRNVKNEVDSGKQATENPTAVHYIRFVREFSKREFAVP